MKKIIVVFLLALILLLESCASQKIDVYGVPGTVVTTSDGSTTLAVIDQSGTAKVKLRRKDGYQLFLQAKAPGSDKNVPFALDYLDKNRTDLNNSLAIIFIPLFGFLGPSWILFSRTGSDYDYDYLKHQTTNSDLIR